MTQCASYEQLSAFEAGHLPPDQLDEIRLHLADCALCRRRLASISSLDALLGQVVDLPPADVLARVASAIGPVDAPREIMTFSEAAEFLRLSDAEMADIAGELPAFELAGQLCIRRSRLLEWIEQRERQYTQALIQSEMTRNIRRSVLFGL